MSRKGLSALQPLPCNRVCPMAADPGRESNLKYAGVKLLKEGRWSILSKNILNDVVHIVLTQGAMCPVAVDAGMSSMRVTSTLSELQKCCDRMNNFSVPKSTPAPPSPREGQCQVCLEDIEDARHVRLQCGHSLHALCFAKYMYHSAKKEHPCLHCPSCRALICQARPLQMRVELQTTVLHDAMLLLMRTEVCVRSGFAPSPGFRSCDSVTRAVISRYTPGSLSP